MLGDAPELTDDAEELEVKIRDLIVAERMSDDFVDEVRALVEERETFRTLANDAVAAAQRDLSKQKMSTSHLPALWLQ